MAHEKIHVEMAKDKLSSSFKDKVLRIETRTRERELSRCHVDIIVHELCVNTCESDLVLQVISEETL